MKKSLIIAAAMLIAASAFAAKPKGNLQVVLDLSQPGTLTPVAATADQPEKPSFKTPRTGVVLPDKRVKDVEEALPLGFLDCSKDDKPGMWFPYSAYSFESDGQKYEIVLGTVKTPGRTAYIYYSKKSQGLNWGRPTLSVPKIDGMVLKSVKIYTAASKYSNERFVFRFFKNDNKKDVIATSTAPAVNEDSVLEASFSDLAPEDNVFFYSNASYTIRKIEFNYLKEKKGKK